MRKGLTVPWVPRMQPATEATTTRAAASPGAVANPVYRVNAPTSKRIRVREVFTTLPAALVLAVRDFQTRYKQSVLGPIWLIIQPLTMVAGFTVVFGSVAEVDTNGIP